MSKLTGACMLLALFNSVVAQTPTSFEPKVDNSLQVEFGTTQIAQAGEMVPREQTANPPNFTSPAGVAGNGLVVMIDIDISNGSGQPRTTLLHWLAYGIDLNTSPAKVPTGNGAPYLQPSPPAGDIAHRYVVLLYPQPANFALPPQYADFSTTDKRKGFNITDFATACGLAAPLAANYIEVQNVTVSSSSTMMSSTGTAQATSATAASSAASSGSSTSHASAPTQFAIEWSLLAGAGFIAAVV